MSLSNSDPLVVAIMLTRDRPEMAARAIQCFRRQTYKRKRLLVWNTGEHALFDEASGCLDVSAQIHEPCLIGYDDKDPIGMLRNHAIETLDGEGGSPIPDVIVHWDDDDWSHPDRIAEQVALLQSTAADCVGYREMLFWDEREGGAAWLYSNIDERYVLGTSMCYRVEAWKAQPFEDVSTNEDGRWWLKRGGRGCVGVSSLLQDRLPRMVARIHAGNTSTAYRPAVMEQAREWQRTAAWAPRWLDAHCREVMEGK